jgi:hypothetical protein
MRYSSNPKVRKVRRDKVAKSKAQEKPDVESKSKSITSVLLPWAPVVVGLLVGFGGPLLNSLLSERAKHTENARAERLSILNAQHETVADVLNRRIAVLDQAEPVVVWWFDAPLQYVNDLHVLYNAVQNNILEEALCEERLNSTGYNNISTIMVHFSSRFKELRDRISSLTSTNDKVPKPQLKDLRDLLAQVKADTAFLIHQLPDLFAAP